MSLRRLEELRPHPLAERVPRMGRWEFEALSADVAKRGLVQPLDVTAAGIVLDGHERLRAAEEVGLSHLPVRVVTVSDELDYMLRAAVYRRQLTPSQRAALALEIGGYEELRQDAQSRQRANLRQAPERAKLPPRGRTRAIVAGFAGVSERTLQDALTVRQADKALFGRVKAGKLAVDVAARRVRRALRDAGLPPAPPLPEGPFQVIYADPPWQLGSPDGRYAPEQHYRTLPTEEIKAIVIPAAEHAVLFLWAVNCLLPEAMAVMEAWGFSYQTNFAWVKPSIGTGNYVRNRHELLLVGKRGSLPGPDPEDRPDSVIEAARGRHSEKPESVYELIERMYPRESKLELFARGKPWPGWVAWGDEVETA